MTETKSSGPKSIIIIVAAVIVVGLIIAGVFFLRKTEKHTPPPPVGSIDRDKVLSTKAFEDANKKIEELTEKYKKDFEEATKNLDENNEEHLNKIIEMRMKVQEDLSKETNTIIYPLMKNAEAAVALVALENNMNTVLDKGIVVCGAVDITDEVIAKMKENQNLEMPDEATIKEQSGDSKIGYFDKSVVVSLPGFREADGKLQKLQMEYKDEYEKTVNKQELSEEQQMMLQLSFMEKIQKAQDDLYAPLFREVNRTVKQVAEESSLDLVVNKENVMYGGVNLTDQVADKLAGLSKEE